MNEQETASMFVNCTDTVQNWSFCQNMKDLIGYLLGKTSNSLQWNKGGLYDNSRTSLYKKILSTANV